jgi:hypothetical protein
VRLRAFDFTSEEGVELRLWLLTEAKAPAPGAVVLTAVDEAGWRDFVRGLGPAFKDLLQLRGDFERDAGRFGQLRQELGQAGGILAVLAPRGVGPTRWAAEASAADTQIRRRFPLLGQTLDGRRVWDVRRALDVLRGLRQPAGAPFHQRGKGDMAGILLYAGLFEPEVGQFDLWDLPPSHRQGPTLLNVRRILDTPQAVALAFPRAVRLHVAGPAAAWDWPLRLQRALGQESLKIAVAGN